MEIFLTVTVFQTALSTNTKGIPLGFIHSQIFVGSSLRQTVSLLSISLAPILFTFRLRNLILYQYLLQSIPSQCLCGILTNYVNLQCYPDPLQLSLTYEEYCPGCNRCRPPSTTQTPQWRWWHALVGAPKYNVCLFSHVLLLQ